MNRIWRWLVRVWEWARHRRACLTVAGALIVVLVAGLLLYGRWGGVPVVVSGAALLLWVVGCVLYYYVWLNGNGAAKAVVVETIVLTITLLAVGWYALEARKMAGETKTLADWTKDQALETGRMAEATSDLAKQAKQQAEATHRLAQAALEDRASILVVEYDDKGLETVGACEKKGIEIKGLTDDPAKHDWLVIKITNEGNRTAHNVRAIASWDTCKEEASTKNTGWMAENRGALGKHAGKVWHYWRVWQLHEHDERFFYVRPPKPPPTKSDKSISLAFTWYDPLYYGWTNHIRVLKPADKWYTSWDAEATPVPQW